MFVRSELVNDSDIRVLRLVPPRCRCLPTVALQVTVLFVSLVVVSHLTYGRCAGTGGGQTWLLLPNVWGKQHVLFPPINPMNLYSPE